jgi:hypothetical protein
MYSLFCYICLHVSGAICTHPQEHKLQSTAIGVCNGYGMLVHRSRYWLGHTHTFYTVRLHHVTRHNTPIHNILSTAPRLSISLKALGTLPEDGNVMPKHVGATIHN